MGLAFALAASPFKALRVRTRGFGFADSTQARCNRPRSIKLRPCRLWPFGGTITHADYALHRLGIDGCLVNRIRRINSGNRFSPYRRCSSLGSFCEGKKDPSQQNSRGFDEDDRI